MYKIGLFLVTKGLTEKNLSKIYSFAKIHIKYRLYLSVKGYYPWNGDWKNNIQMCYNTANKFCPELDVRLILPHSVYRNDREISVILCDDKQLNLNHIQPLIDYVTKSVPEKILNIEGDGICQKLEVDYEADFKPKYQSVVLGGTFDHMHNGHKILLSTAALLTHNRLFCGISDDELLRNKVLADLIEPLSQRIEITKSFLQDIKPGLDYSIESIQHPNGPTTELEHFQCIIASSETSKGCESINTTRVAKGFKPMDTELIEMVDQMPNNEDDKRFSEILTECKVSSTRNRLKLLGKLLRSPNRSVGGNSSPYIIGLTGGIGSGKSSIAKKLGGLGAHVIDCDKLGHEAYLPDTQCYRALVDHFGSEIINSTTGEINRAVLGSKVFGNAAQMTNLTNIVWPAIARMTQQIINQSNCSVVVVDAAVLLDAGWQNTCHEVWVAFVPRDEAIKRIRDRNKLSEEQAIKRLSSQKSNRHYLEAAHVVFCSLWSYEFTGSQISMAWNELQQRL